MVIILANNLRFLECADALIVKTTKVVLNILNIVFEVVADYVAVLTDDLRIAWYERSRRCDAGARET